MIHADVNKKHSHFLPTSIGLPRHPSGIINEAPASALFLNSGTVLA
jgi:hypothetical protein